MDPNSDKIRMIKNETLYDVQLKNGEIIKAVYYFKYYAPVFYSFPDIISKSTLPDPKLRLPTETEHHNCFVSGNRILSSEEIDYVFEDNEWWKFDCDL